MRPARGDKNGLSEGKPRWDLLPVGAAREVVRVLTYGAAKYGAHNWAKGIPYSEVYSGVLRHLTSWWEGEETKDPETGLHPLAHAMCGALFLLHYELAKGRYTHHDDRQVHTDTAVFGVASTVRADTTYVGMGDNPNL